MNVTAEWFNTQVLIPDLLRAAPQARPVLDRYGLRGGGELATRFTVTASRSGRGLLPACKASFCSR